MAFTAKNSDNTIAAVVNDYEATIVGGLQLLGYGYVNYAEEIANNFVRVAENFANSTPPQNPLRGQLWWDISNGSSPALWVCRDPTAAATPTTARWSMIFQVNSSTGAVDASTLRSMPPSTTSAANTIVARDGSGKIDLGSLPGSVANPLLSTLGDVTVSGPSTTQVLRYNGTKWANTKLALSDIQNVDTSGAVNGSILKFNGTNWVVGVDAVGSSGSTATWGGITGTVTNQTDLVNYINNMTWPISSVSGLSTALSGKLDMATLLASDGSGSGLDADKLDGQDGAYYTNLANMTGSLPSSAIISSSNYGSNGWAQIGAMMLQWGAFYMSSGLTSATCTMPTSFPNACLNVVWGGRGRLDASGGSDQNNVYIWCTPNGSTSSFTVSFSGSDRASVYVAWMAIGY